MKTDQIHLPKTMHFAGVYIRIYAPGTLLDTNLQSVKSLLHFVVCFIVWTGEYHTLTVDPLYCFETPAVHNFSVYFACCTHHCQLD